MLNSDGVVSGELFRLIELLRTKNTFLRLHKEMTTAHFPLNELFPLLHTPKYFDSTVENISSTKCIPVVVFIAVLGPAFRKHRWSLRFSTKHTFYLDLDRLFSLLLCHCGVVARCTCSHFPSKRRHLGSLEYWDLCITSTTNVNQRKVAGKRSV